MCYVYILKCKDGYYVGCTSDLRQRIVRHKNGQVHSTAQRLPVKLIFYFACLNEKIAFRFEKYLKSGSGRSFVQRHLEEVS
jgi:predicted GIY-YIG superfamily endonuclease